MKTLRGFVICLLVFGFGMVKAQIPQGYYDATYGFNGLGLKITLHNIIKNHNVVSYNALYSVFSETDNKGNNVVWDIYSDNPYGNEPYVYYYTNPSHQCGQYSSEGDCFNREHSWPQSWFGSSSIPVYSDLFHVYPTDGWVNNKRGNFPYGEVNNPTWTSLNGSKLGPCSFPGYASTVFEPINEYKGDIARSYFYISVRYYGQDMSWPGSAQTEGAELKPWAYNLMYKWHIQDPVSQKETDRNDAIYQYQNNRNPFIDHPEWVDSILYPLGLIDTELINNNTFVYPNPVSEWLTITSTKPIQDAVIYDALSKKVLSVSDLNSTHVQIDLRDLQEGFYFLFINSGNRTEIKKIIKVRT